MPSDSGAGYGSFTAGGHQMPLFNSRGSPSARSADRREEALHAGDSYQAPLIKNMDSEIFSREVVEDGPAVSRDILLHALEARAKRVSKCRSVPCSIAVYAAFILALITHCRTGPAYDFEMSINTDIIYYTDFVDVINTPASWFAWASDALLPTLLVSSSSDVATDDDLFEVGAGRVLATRRASATATTNSAGGQRSRRLAGADRNNLGIEPTVAGRVVNNYGLIIGGIRLAQTRATAIDCPDSDLRQLYGDACYDHSKPSTSTYGNASAAVDYDLSSAFSISTTPNSNGESAFQLYLNALDDLATGQGYVNGLEQAGWIDEATSQVVVQIALLNGQINYFGIISLVADFTLGGRIATDVRAGSFDAQPYLQQPWIVSLDIVVIGYTLYLMKVVVTKLVRYLRSRTISSSGGGGGDVKSLSSSSGHLEKESCGVACARCCCTCLCGYSRRGGASSSRVGCCGITGMIFQFFLTNVWRTLDLAALFSLIATIVCWVQFLLKCRDIRDAIRSDPDADPVGYAGGEHAGTAAAIFAAYQSHQTWKIASVWALIFLSLRLFKYFQFQPRLAVMTDSLIMAFSDSVHFAILFAVVLACYGTWGYFMFGSQAPDWADLNISIVSVFRHMMYDYDLWSMRQTFPGMANFFNASFMLIVTNMTLWMFLAIILESYTEIRAQSHDQPSIVDESAALIRALPGMISVPRWLGGTGRSAHPSWAEVRKAVKTGSLSRFPLITAGQLQRYLGMPAESANTLVLEALSGKGPVYQGYSSSASRGASSTFTATPRDAIAAAAAVGGVGAGKGVVVDSDGSSSNGGDDGDGSSPLDRGYDVPSGAAAGPVAVSAKLRQDLATLTALLAATSAGPVPRRSGGAGVGTTGLVNGQPSSFAASVGNGVGAATASTSSGADAVPSTTVPGVDGPLDLDALTAQVQSVHAQLAELQLLQRRSSRAGAGGQPQGGRHGYAASGVMMSSVGGGVYPSMPGVGGAAAGPQDRYQDLPGGQ